MAYKVLVLGGSYFFGRIFCTLASRAGDMELTLVNRGRYSMSHLPQLRELTCDRHDAAALRDLPREDWDALVDFCAYEPGDISGLLEALPGSVKRYVYISTADIYRRDPGAARDEAAPLLDGPGAGAAGDYAYKKRLLEDELAEACALGGTERVSLRPAFLYGPYNYAPRESFYIEKVVRREPLPFPTDADGRFQTVYVKDASEAVLACIRQEAAAGQAYNLASPEVLDYRSFIAALRAAADRPFTLRELTVEESFREQIPLPFPLTAEESELFSGEKLTRELGIAYTPFSEGLEKTFRAFRSVYE